MKLLSIQIPTICSRLKEFTKLYTFLQKQVKDNNLEDKVEIIYERDNKEMSIGAKRQNLYERANAKFAVQIDDDDKVHENYISILVDVIENNPTADFIGYYERVSNQEGIFLTKHSNSFGDWFKYIGNDLGMQIKYARTPFFKDPILTEYCLRIGVSDMRFCEDIDFARRLKQSNLIQSEVFIPEIMYIYDYKYELHETKYGFKR